MFPIHPNENAPVRLGESIAILFLAAGIASVSLGFELLGDQLERFYAMMLPEGAQLPAFTRLMFNAPLLIIGGVLSLILLFAAINLRWLGGMRRHLTLLISLGWALLALGAGLSVAGLLLPVVSFMA